jgi:hypothetical protein
MVEPSDPKTRRELASTSFYAPISVTLGWCASRLIETGSIVQRF